MNKQSNLYTIIYIIVLVVVVGVALAATSLALAPRQEENQLADTKRQILASVRIVPENDAITEDFSKYIVEQIVVNSEGKTIEGTEALKVNVAAQSKLADNERELPVYVCRLDNGDTKYILPVYGAGLWGPIWGYVAFDSNGTTIYGAYFAHQGETPGLGAEIEKPAFSNQFEGKRVFIDGAFKPVAVVKAGQQPLNGEDYVNGISGGTITSKGVGAMIDNCLSPYRTYLENLSNN